MASKTKTRFPNGPIVAALSLLVLPFLPGGEAAAMYAKDGAVAVSAGLYANPNDGFCVSGIKTDGTMAVVPGITNFRDCVAYTSGLAAMIATDVTARNTCPTSGVAPFNKACNTSATCTKLDGSLTWVAALQKCFDTSACTVQGATDGDAVAHACAVPNDGAKHVYSSSLCVNAATRAGISRVNLDNTAANCQQKGGVLSDGLFGHPYGACSAYGWVYGGVKTNGTAATIGAKGVTSADNLGFCYASMRMTTLYGTVVTCPSQNNLSRVCAGGANLGKTCTVATQAADCPTSTCVLNSANGGWSLGTDGAVYQSQTSYDAGLGWSFASSHCLYQYGTKGYVGADLLGPDGKVPTTVALCAGGSGSATAGTCIDLTGITTQGDCLAVGGAWDNWLPVGTGAAPYAATQTVLTTPVNSTIKKLDAITSVAGGGGNFYTNTGFICTKCHTDQSRAYIERYKPGFVEGGHKLAGDTAPYTGVGDAWGLKGVQCPICHATAKAGVQDVGAVIYPTKICVGGTKAGTACTDDTPCLGGGVCTAGVPRGASGHNQTEYGTHLIGVCFTCHGTAAVPESDSPAANIPVSAGDFATTSKNLAPIANQFLNSPHAKYAGSSNKLNIITKTNYASRFNGKVCKSGSEVTDAATSANGVDVTAASTCGAGGASVCNTSANCSATPGGNRVWNAVTSKCYDKGVCAGAAGKTWDTVTLRCVESQTTCQAQSDSGYPFVWSPTGSSGILSTITTSGAGCFKAFGSGNTLTTYWKDGAAHKIPNVDSDTNLACTSPTEGAGGFWTGDGETAGSTNGVAFPSTDQGNCMTCHDVHWALDAKDATDKSTCGVHGALPCNVAANCTATPGGNRVWNATASTCDDEAAEPFRRECTTCHMNPGTSATTAPQIDLTTINHLKTAGTPLENWATDPDSACETCHMPLSGSAGSSLMHLWRINPDPTYTTMGATTANTTADGSAWVDLDHACGQCHGGGTVQDIDHLATPPALYRTKAQLATVAKGMHDAAAVSYSVTFTAKMTGRTVDVAVLPVNCGVGIVCPTFDYDWAWGDATPNGSGSPASHPYDSYAARTIKLTVRLHSNSKVVGTASRSVLPVAPTVSFTAAVTGLKVDVAATPNCGGVCPALSYDWNWFDGTAHGSGVASTHTYASPGTKTVMLTVSDTGRTLVRTARNVLATAVAPDVAPTASATCTWNASTWTATVVDTSTDPNTLTSPVQSVSIDWGDLSGHGVGSAGATFVHTYVAPPTLPATSYTLTFAAVDTALNASAPVTLVCTPTAVAPAYFSISGTVYAKGGVTPLATAAVTLKKGSTVKTVFTGAGGAFSAGSLKPGTYTLTVVKAGYTFASPAATITVGPSKSGNNLIATAP